MAEARAAAIVKFLSRAGWDDARATPLAGDASARRYVRLARGRDRAILMDADPARGERVDHFLTVGTWLSAQGYSAPEVLAKSPDLGLLLLEDLGDDLVARLTARDPDCEGVLYAATTGFLTDLHGRPPPDFMARAGGTQLGALTRFIADYYLPATGADPAVARALPDLVASLFDGLGGRADRVSLRDFHAENLIWLPERKGVARLGLLDFQDAFVTDRAYDLVSLCQDARRDVSPETESACIRLYLDENGLSEEAFLPLYALVGAQRALRIIGVFARLCTVGGRPHYLEFMPRVWSYLERNLAHPALWDLAALVARAVPPPEPTTRQRIAEKCATIPAP